MQRTKSARPGNSTVLDCQEVNLNESMLFFCFASVDIVDVWCETKDKGESMPVAKIVKPVQQKMRPALKTILLRKQSYGCNERYPALGFRSQIKQMPVICRGH